MKVYSFILMLTETVWPPVVPCGKPCLHSVRALFCGLVHSECIENKKCEELRWCGHTASHLLHYLYA